MRLSRGTWVGRGGQCPKTNQEGDVNDVRFVKDGARRAPCGRILGKGSRLEPGSPRGARSSPLLLEPFIGWRFQRSAVAG